MAASPRKLRIFVSHNHKDNDFGIRLVDDLRRAIGDESAVWYDSRGGLKGGDLWWSVICQELKKRNTFIVVLSPHSLKAPWVRKEMRMALMYHLQRSQKIIPLLYQPCNIPDDFRDIQAISFLPDRSYEDAFQELEQALQLSGSRNSDQNIKSFNEYKKDKVQYLIHEVEVAYYQERWPLVIEKVNMIANQYPETALSDLYCMQGWAYYFENQLSLAREALERGIKLVQDPQKQLALLDAYATQLVSNGQWNELLACAGEALQLDPHNSNWQMVKIDALEKIYKSRYKGSGHTGALASDKEDLTERQTRSSETDSDSNNAKSAFSDEQNVHFIDSNLKSQLSEQDIREIELQKQKLILQKEQFQLEKEIITFACEMAERVASISTDENSFTKAELIQTLLPQFLFLKDKKEC